MVSCSDSDKEDSRPEKKEMITFKNKKEAIEAFKMLLKDKVYFIITCISSHTTPDRFPVNEVAVDLCRLLATLSF